MSTFYRQRPGWKFSPAVRGEGVSVWDHTGRRLIDAAGGALVVNIGHAVSVDILGDAIGAATRSVP